MTGISVVIPSIGVAPVERAVTSVAESAAAGGIDAEIIVVWQAAGEPGPIPGAKVIAVHDVNGSYTRNRGADEASADLIGYVDDDEVVDPGWVGAAVRALADADAAFGPVEPLDDEGRPYYVTEQHTPRVFEGYVAPWLVGTGGSMAFRREALAAVGGFDPRLGPGSNRLCAEDTDVIWRLLQAGRRIRFSPEMVVYHPTKTDEEILASRYPYGFGTGTILRRARSLRLTANSGHAIVHANATALLSGAPERRREAAAFARGVLAGALTPVRWRAPELAGEPVPSNVAEALGGRHAKPLPVSWSARPHYIWDCGDEVLHAFIGANQGRLEAPAARERIRAMPGVTRIPPVLAHGRSRDALWVLEERVTGTGPDLARPESWWPGAAEWTARYARHPFDPFGESEEWQLDSEQWPAFAPEGLGDAVRAALARAAARPAGPSHGDLQPKNLVVTAGGITAIDWEWASTEGVRGGDLVLLAIDHGGVVPDEEVARSLAEGRNPDFGDVLGPLRVMGLDGQELRDTLLLLLLKWACSEHRRHHELGADPQPPTYGPMAQNVVPLLV